VPCALFVPCGIIVFGLACPYLFGRPFAAILQPRRPEAEDVPEAVAVNSVRLLFLIEHLAEFTDEGIEDPDGRDDRVG